MYQPLRTQWRSGLNGRTGLDYTPFIALIGALGWPMQRALALLQGVEMGFLAAWRAKDG